MAHRRCELTTRRGFLERTALLGAISGPLLTRVPNAAARSLGPADQDPSARVVVSRRDPRYLELSDGRPYLPIGFNLVGPPEAADLQRVVERMAASGVNYCRIWLDQPLWSIEAGQSGRYDADRAAALDRFLDLCRPRGIRVKMCVEWFRTIEAQPSQPPQRGSFPKPLHHTANGGFYDDMTDFLESERGRAQFKAKLAWYADRYGDDPAVFAWELWNEMNAVRGPWYDWTRVMLAELKRLFPRTLAVQSLGSFDRDTAREQYRLLCELADNDVLQVHRYLDQGAQLDVCHGPVDVLAADAVAELRAFGIRKPIILTETGAVKPSHTGVSELYALDPEGTLLHDMLFAPFFAGAAGPGHVWWWRDAIDGPDQWHHFLRFRRAVSGLDVPAESFEPALIETPELRIHALRGKNHSIAWCRDRSSDWKSELQQGQPARPVEGIELDGEAILGLKISPAAKVTVYDPWNDREADAMIRGDRVGLPPFRRSLVVRIALSP